MILAAYGRLFHARAGSMEGMARPQFSLRRLLVSIGLCAIGLALLRNHLAFVQFWAACTLFGAAIGLPFGRPWSWAGLAVGCMVGFVGWLILMRIVITC